MFARARKFSIGRLAILAVLGLGIAAASALGTRAVAGPAFGYGQCRKCSCGSFRGNGNWCKCDHSFYDHQ